MICRIAVNLSFWCRKMLNMEEEERQIVQYGLEVLLDGFIKIAILLAIGYLLGCPGEFGLTLLAFCSLRYWAGGVHCKTSTRCLGAMLLLCIISTYGGRYILTSPEKNLGGIVTLSYIVLIFLAPGLTKKSLNMSEGQRYRKRFGAIAWITMEYGIVMAIENVHFKWCIVIAIIIEVLSVIPCWKEQRRRRRKNYVQEKRSSSREKNGGDFGQKCRGKKGYYNAI